MVTIAKTPLNYYYLLIRFQVTPNSLIKATLLIQIALLNKQEISYQNYLTRQIRILQWPIYLTRFNDYGTNLKKYLISICTLRKPHKYVFFIWVKMSVPFLNKSPLHSPLASKTYGQLTPPARIKGHTLSHPASKSKDVPKDSQLNLV